MLSSQRRALQQEEEEMGEAYLEIATFKRETSTPKRLFLNEGSNRGWDLPSASSGPLWHFAVKQLGTGGPSPGEQGV